MSTNKVAYIAPETIVSIEVSGAFNNHLNMLLFTELQHFDEKEQADILERIKKAEAPLSPREAIIQTLSMIISAVVESAKKDNKVLYKEPDLAAEEIKELISNIKTQS